MVGSVNFLFIPRFRSSTAFSFFRYFVPSYDTPFVRSMISFVLCVVRFMRAFVFALVCSFVRSLFCVRYFAFVRFFASVRYFSFVTLLRSFFFFLRSLFLLFVRSWARFGCPIYVHQVWDFSDAGGGRANCLKTLRGHDHNVSCVAWVPPSGDTLVSCSRDQTIRFWEVRLI